MQQHVRKTDPDEPERVENQSTREIIMATNEVENPKPGSGHPPYAEMIIAAITSLNEKNGSSKVAIAKYIDSTFSNLPATHASLLGTHLHRLKEAGELFMVKHSYKLGQPKKPIASPRGRGRPRNPNLISPAVASGVKRSRGRPPKDPNAPPRILKLKDPLSPPRPRGRPPKNPGALKLKDPLAPPRPRGRPPSLLRPRKPLKPLTGRPRGRPRKLLDSTGPVSPSSKPRGRPPTKVHDPSSPPKRRGRPPKAVQVVEPVLLVQPVSAVAPPVEGGVLGEEETAAV